MASRAFGYGMITVAAAWFLLNGACSIQLVAHPAPSFPIERLVPPLSPLIFGPPAFALWLGWRILKRSGRVDRGRAEKPASVMRLAIGVLMIIVGVFVAFVAGGFIYESIFFDSLRTYSDWLPVIAFLLHPTLFGLLMIVAGAWVAESDRWPARHTRDDG